MPKLILLIAICMASFLGCLDLTIVNTALPAIKTAFHVDMDTLQWVMTALLLTLSSTMVLAGKIADIVGQRTVMLFGLILFGLASLIAAVAHSFSFLIGGRVLQGMGIAILYTTPPALITYLFDKDKISKVMGYYFSASSLGIASGPLVGGVIVSTLGWRWIFYLNLPIVFVVFLICWLYLPKLKQFKKEKLDVIGALLLALSLISLTLMTNYIQTHYWTWVFAGIGLISLIIFCLHEFNIPEPMLDLKLFKITTFTLGGMANISLAFFYDSPLLTLCKRL